MLFPDAKMRLAQAVAAIAVYALVCGWLAQVLPFSFWQICLGFFLIRVAFAAIEILINVLWWRISGRRQSVGEIVEILRKHRFPRPEVKERPTAYLERVWEGRGYPYKPFPMAMRLAARDLYALIDTGEKAGMLRGARMWDAVATAMGRYVGCAEPITEKLLPGASEDLAEEVWNIARAAARRRYKATLRGKL